VCLEKKGKKKANEKTTRLGGGRVEKEKHEDCCGKKINRESPRENIISGDGKGKGL